MSHEVPSTHSTGDWADALDSIAADIVRSLIPPPAPAVAPPVPEASLETPPEAAPQGEPELLQPDPVCAEPLAPPVPPLPNEAPVEPVEREGDSEVLVEATRHLHLASAHLDRLQACLEQAEQKAGLATGQLTIEAELLERFREELAEARQRLAGWSPRAAG